MKQNRVIREDFLQRVHSEIIHRTDLELTKDQIWIVFCILFCTMLQMTVESSRLTINNWISFSIVTSKRAKNFRVNLQARLSKSVQSEVNRNRPNFFFSLLNMALFNKVITDIEPDRVIYQEEYDPEDDDCDCDEDNSL